MLLGNDWKSSEMCQIGCSERFQTTSLGKVAKHGKLAVLSDFRPLRCEKVGKVVKHAKLAVPSDFRPFGGKRLEKLQNVPN